MNCPRCHDAYLEGTYVGATAVERCPACMGHWFRKGELVAFLKSPTVGYHAQHVAVLRIPAMPVTEQPSCGTCRVTLRRARPAQLGQAAVDVCPRCGGTWLDGVEFQRVLVHQSRQKGFLRSLLDTVEFVLGVGRKGPR